MFLALGTVFAAAGIVWLGGAAFAWIDSSRRFASRAPRFIWVGVVLLTSVIGVAAYLLVRPETRAKRRARRYRVFYLETLAASEERGGDEQAPATALAAEEPPARASAPVEIPAV
jgi:hypothetical protein